MKSNRDLKLKAPIVEDYGISLEEAFKKGMEVMRNRYRAKLFMFKKQHDAEIKKHDEEREVSRIQGKLELIHDLFRKSALTEEKEKLESELVLAEAKASDVDILYVDWYKMNEPQMYR